MPPGARHLRSILLWVVALLYGGVWAHASEAPHTSAVQGVVDAKSAPHIALLLPTGSDVFATRARGVRPHLASLPAYGTSQLSLAPDGQVRRTLPVARVARGQLTVTADAKP